MFQNLITLTGATQFSAGEAVATFLEATDITLKGPDLAPRILGYSYTSLGTAATVTLRLAPVVGAALDLQIDLEVPTVPVNSFTNVCGRGGPIVPRLFGLQNDGAADQTLDVTLGMSNDAIPMVLLFSTGGKDDRGTFRVWYDYVDVGGSN